MLKNITLHYIIRVGSVRVRAFNACFLAYHFITTIYILATSRKWRGNYKIGGIEPSPTR